MKTQADSYEINKDHRSDRGGVHANSFPAGREGVRNRDLNGLLTLSPVAGHDIDFEAGYGRQGNIYSGDTQNTNTNADVPLRIGSETNRIYRQNYSVTHRGQWNADTSTLSYVQYERTRNTRILEGLAGGTEGIFNPTGDRAQFGDINLRSWTAHAEVNRRLEWGGIPQMATLGVEWVSQKLEDNASDLKGRNPQVQVPEPTSGYQPNASARIFSVFAESNIYATDALILTPGLRFDHHDRHGSNWSPSLNASYSVNSAWTVKAGIARAYKAPNLYQSNGGYALYSAGIGCPGGQGTPAGCFLVGNADLKAETSINKELGVQYTGEALQASLTYFRNDYRDKVEAGQVAESLHVSGRREFYWENVPKAVIEGLEGNVRWPIQSNLDWNTNFTYILKSKNKSTGEYLSTIPVYTINTTLDWSLNERFTVQAKATFYGEQKPQKYDYQGNRVTGSAADKRDPYMLFGLSGRYRINKSLSLTAGIDNLFDKRLFREGNASGVTGAAGSYISGAGANTYNEPGRTYFLSMTASF